MAVPSFLFGGSTGETPDSIRRKRDLVRAIMGASNAPRNVGEGLNALGDGIVANVLDRRANTAEKSGTDAANSLFNSIIGSPMPGATGSAMPSVSAGGNIPPVDLSGNDVYNGFIDTVKTGVKNPYGLAAVAATGRAESGYDPKKAVSTWSDPSESGQPGTSGGIMSWRGPRYAALAATGDLSPQGQGKFFLSENPQLIDGLNNAKSVDEAQNLINNAWKFAGYNKPGGESARRLAYAQSFLPGFQGQGGGTQVASLDPAAGMSDMPQQAPVPTPAPQSPFVPKPMQGPMPFDNGRFADASAPMTMATGNVRGLVSPGNIDLSRRPVVKNPDGSISTVRSMSFEQDGKEILVPTVSPDGRILSDQEAIDQYRKTGQNLGVFDNANDATTYAQTLHNQQADMYAPKAAPPLPPPTTVAPAPPVASVPDVQVAQAGQPQMPQTPANPFANIDPRLLQAVNNPFLNPGQRAVIQSMIDAQLQAQQSAREEQTWRAREDYKTNVQKADPAYQLEQDYKRAQLEALKNKTGKSNLINAGEGNIYDPDTQTWIKAPSAQGQSGGGFRFGGNSVEAQALNGLIDSGQLTAGQAQQLAAGKTISGPNGELLFLTPQGIFSQNGQSPAQPVQQQQPQQQPYVDLFGDGAGQQQPAAAPRTDRVQQDGNAIPITAPKAPNSEQLNAASFADRMVNSGQILDQYENQGLNGFDQFLTRSPWVPSFLGNTIIGNTNPDYQLFDQARRDFINAQLRRESGAVIGQDEFDNADKQYFPQPGEGPDVVEQKRRARQIAIDSMTRSAGPTYQRPAQKPSESGDIKAAREAIAKGAPRDKVIERLKAAGIDTTGL